MNFRIVAALTAGALLTSSSLLFAGSGTMAKSGSMKLTMESVGPIEEWRTFRNNKNHFEFKVPTCLVIGTSDYENEPQDSNVVEVLSGTKCGNGYELVMEFGSRNTARISFDRLLTNKEYIVRRELDLNGTRAVITADRGRKKYCTQWKVYSHCHGRNMAIQFGECMDLKRYESLEKGIGEPGPVLKAIMESFKCLKN